MFPDRVGIIECIVNDDQTMPQGYVYIPQYPHAM